MTDDDLDRSLGELPGHDVGAWRREHVRNAAHAALARPASSRAARLYTRVIEPALVATVCAAHLFWAISAAAAILLH